jgi:Holliday junction resolvase
MVESQYQAKLIKKLERRFRGCEVLKTDSGFQQGIPDLLVLYDHMWAALEVKASADSPLQPNQEYYITHFNNMSFGAIIFPENEAEVLDALQQAFEVSRRTCVP